MPQRALENLYLCLLSGLIINSEFFDLVCFSLTDKLLANSNANSGRVVRKICSAQFLVQN